MISEKRTNIGYSCGYGPYKIWLTIWIGDSLDIVATRLMIGNEYHDTSDRLKENKNKIEWLFSEEAVDCRLFPGNVQRNRGRKTCRLNPTRKLA